MFALLTMFLTPLMANGYIVASLIANVFSITFAFLGYKWFVFRTKGNYLKEWLRCLGVYSVSILFSAATLPLAVALIRRHGGSARTAPYLAGALVLSVSVAFSFFGHRRISFGISNRGPQLRHCNASDLSDKT